VDQELLLVGTNEDSDDVVEVLDVTTSDTVSFALPSINRGAQREGTYLMRFAARWSPPMSSALRPRLGVSSTSMGSAIVRPGSIFAGVVVLKQSKGVSR
jgi:hypothetical protein